MDEQHQDFLLANRGRTSNLSTGVVAVVNGDGMVNVFADLGVTAVVLGGHTMNPSTTEILKTVEKMSSNNIIVLPNNKNVIPAALLVQTLTKKNVRVIPTETIPQGISALVSFFPEADFETNLAEMTAAMSTVRTIEATRATRATRVNNLEIRESQFIGLLDGELLAVDNKLESVILQLMDRIELSQAQIVTFYYGRDTTESEAKKLSTELSRHYPELKVGVVKGGQSNYYVIVAVE